MSEHLAPPQSPRNITPPNIHQRHIQSKISNMQQPSWSNINPSELFSGAIAGLPAVATHPPQNNIIAFEPAEE